MENEIYEFYPMNEYHKSITLKFLDNEIGTDYEIDEDDGMFTITVFELTDDEAEKIRAFETENI